MRLCLSLTWYTLTLEQESQAHVEEEIQVIEAKTCLGEEGNSELREAYLMSCKLFSIRKVTHLLVNGNAPCVYPTLHN